MGRRLLLSTSTALLWAAVASASAAGEPVVIAEWGQTGSADGEFNAPQGIAIGLGDVFVSESGNQRVQRFRSNGAFRLKWGNPGPGGSSAPGKFSGPEGIAADSDGAVYVVDSGNDRIQKFTPEGVPITSWGTEGDGPGQFNAPTDVAIDGARNVYVADFGNARVEKFRSDGTFVAAWGSQGTGPGQFDWLEGIAADAAGNVYTVELDGHRVQRFTADGAFAGTWGSEGPGDGQFLAPAGIDVDGSGRVYVVDRDRDDVQVFSPAGAFLSRFGSPGTGPGQFQIPVDVAVDSRGVVYVVDNGLSRVQAFVELPPESVDTDGDALPDRWEMVGLDANGDGKIDVDLPAMGADPAHKDVFVEVDHITNHALADAALERVVHAFAVAPVANPDGSSGIRLHVDNGPDSLMDPRTGTPWGELSRQTKFNHLNVIGSFSGGSYNWAVFDSAKQRYMEAARRRVFHYVISGHRYGSSSNTSSGISRGIGASDLLVTLQGFCAPDDCSGTEAQQAGTFMHELGHNLGLHHGGGDDTNRKPNYLSNMSYTFQMSGLKIDGEAGTLDYSAFGPDGATGVDTIGTLSEGALSETTGFGTASPMLARFSAFSWCKNAWAEYRVGGGIDWNCDGKVEGDSAVDVNGDGATGTLASQDDWSHLAFDGGTIGDASGAPLTPLLASSPRNEASRPTLIEMARVVSGDRRRPRVSLKGRLRGRRRVRVTVRASDNRGVQLVAVQTDRRTRTYRGKGRRRVSIRVSIKGRGRHRVRAVAIDGAGNVASTRRVTANVGH